MSLTMRTDTEHQVHKAGEQHLLIKQAVASRERVIQTGLVFDGKEFGEYLKAKVRGLQTSEYPRECQIKPNA